MTSEYFYVTLVGGFEYTNIPASWTTGELIVKQAARRRLRRNCVVSGLLQGHGFDP